MHSKKQLMDMLHHPMVHHSMAHHPIAHHLMAHHPIAHRVVQHTRPKKQMLKHGGIRGFGILGGELLGGELLGGKRRAPRKKMHKGGSFMSDMEKFAHYISPVAKPIIGALTKKALAGIESAGAGRMRAPRKTLGHARNQARGAIVRQIMMQHGMTLPQASHYVKMHNIPY